MSANEVRSEGEPTAGRSRRSPHLFLIVLSGIYAVWLGWLAYVAWVNVQAGNQ